MSLFKKSFRIIFALTTITLSLTAIAQTTYLAVATTELTTGIQTTGPNGVFPVLKCKIGNKKFTAKYIAKQYNGTPIPYTSGKTAKLTCLVLTAKSKHTAPSIHSATLTAELSTPNSANRQWETISTVALESNKSSSMPISQCTGRKTKTTCFYPLLDHGNYAISFFTFPTGSTIPWL